jgi:L,D-transpeptidase YcbB
MRKFGFLSTSNFVRAGFLVATLVAATTLNNNFAFANAAEEERNKLFDQGGTAIKPKAKKEAPIKVGGVPTSQTEIVAGKNQSPMLVTNADQLLIAAQQKYSGIVAQGGFPTVPNGDFKKGSNNASIGILNKRLFMEGYLRVEGTQGKFAEVYTSATADAVARFQRNHGLIANGKMSSATLAELNISAEKRLFTISANIPRAAAYEVGVGSRYVVVNIPAQLIETVSGGRVVTRHNAIVGRPARPSPVVMTPLAMVRFNPYWNAPVSIVERDILPKLQNSLQYLVDANIKIFKGGATGEEIDPHTLDFSNMVPDDYLFRQEPGPHNAMATAKIEFQSPFGIYLHDTPEKHMFNSDNRFFSSGCIRVEKMPLLVQWVLNGQDGYNEGKIATMAETLERLDVPLSAPPQLRVAYLTAWPASGGTVAFRRDIYELDGTGFTVGQPMPVGEMSPEGKRFVLKPLPRQQSVDAAEAEGFGLFGSRKSGAAKTPLFGKAKPDVAATKKQNIFGKSLFSNTPAKPAVAAATTVATSKTTGLFDWAAYRKKQAAEALASQKAGAKKGAIKPKKVEAAKPADAKKVAVAIPVDPAKPAAKPVNATKPALKKKPECKPSVDGKPPVCAVPAP